MKFQGLVELQANNELLERRIRIERLKQVRNQDKNNSSSRNSQYREVINYRKNRRYEEAKEKKIAVKEEQLNGLKKNWQRSLITTGDAQKAANIEGKKSVLMEISNNQELVKNRNIASKRGNEALSIRHNEIQKNKLIKEQKLIKMSMINEISSSHREDARAYGEYKYAQEEIEKNKNKLDYKYSIIKHQIGAHQSSLSIQNRVPVIVHALIQRHGLPETDTTTIFNTAEAEKDVVIGRTYDKIVVELNAKETTKKRAVLAKKACVKEQALEDMVDTFDFLSKFDKQGGRSNRLKSGVMVAPDIEEPAILQNFENEFLMQEEVISDNDEELIGSNIDDEDTNIRPNKSNDKGWLYQGNTTIVSNTEKIVQEVNIVPNGPSINPWKNIIKKNKTDKNNKETDKHCSNSNYYKITTPGEWNIPKNASNHFQKWEINDNIDYESSINQFNFNNNVANNGMKEYDITDKINQILDPVKVIDNLVVINSRSSSNSYFSDDNEDDVHNNNNDNNKENLSVSDKGSESPSYIVNYTGYKNNSEFDEINDEFSDDNEDDHSNFNLNQFNRASPNIYTKEEMLLLNPLSHLYKPYLNLAENNKCTDYNEENDNLSINSSENKSSSFNDNKITNQRGFLLDLQIDVDVSPTDNGNNEAGEIDKSWFNEISNNDDDANASIDISHSSTIDARHDINNSISSSISKQDDEDSKDNDIDHYYRPINKSTEEQAEIIDAMLQLRKTVIHDSEELDEEQILIISPQKQNISTLKSPILSTSIINSTVSEWNDNVSDISDNEDNNNDKEIKNDEIILVNQSIDSIKSLELINSQQSNKSYISLLQEENSTKSDIKNSNKDDNFNESLNSVNMISITESANSLSILSSTINSDLIISAHGSDNEDNDVSEDNGNDDALLTREMIHNEISNMRLKLISLNQGITNKTSESVDVDNYFDEDNSSDIFNLNDSTSSRKSNLRTHSDDNLDDDSIELVLNNVDIVNRKNQFSHIRNSSEEVSLEYLLGPINNNLEDDEENNPILTIYNDDNDNDDDEISTGSLSSSGFINSSLRLSNNSINNQNTSEFITDKLNKLKNSKELLKSHLLSSSQDNNSHEFNKNNGNLENNINYEFNDSDELDLGEGLEMYRSLNSSIVSSTQSLKSNSSLNSSSVSSGSNLVNMSLKSSQLYDATTNSLSYSKITSSIISKWEQDESNDATKILNNNEISFNSSMSDDELNNMSLMSSESLK